MGKENDAMLEFLRDELRFADLFNGSLFAGEQVVKAADLQDAGEAYSRFTEDETAPNSAKTGSKKRKRKNRTRTIFRDIKKRMSSGTELRILAVEEQGCIDYTMPCRHMEYDSAEYIRQKKKLQRKNSMIKDYETKDERLCKFRKTDRLTPVYTICLYIGEKPWDGPRSLRDMMDFGTGEAADRWAEHFSDYEMKLVCVNELENVEQFTSELKTLFALMHLRNDKQGMYTYLAEHVEYKNIDEDTAKVISTVMGVNTFMKDKDKFRNKQGGYDMCQAIREMWEDGVQVGLERGKSEGIQIGKVEGIQIGLDCGKNEGIQIGLGRGKSEGISLSAAIFRAVNAGVVDNEQLSRQCGCSEEQVAEVRKAFGL